MGPPKIARRSTVTRSPSEIPTALIHARSSSSKSSDTTRAVTPTAIADNVSGVALARSADSTRSPVCAGDPNGSGMLLALLAMWRFLGRFLEEEDVGASESHFQYQKIA